MIRPKKNFIDILLEGGKLSQEGLERVMTCQREEKLPLEEIILKMRLVSKEDLLEAKGKAWGVEYINLALVEDFEQYAQLLPEVMCRRYQMVCISKVDKTLVLVMANPLDVFALDDVKLRTGYETRPLIGLGCDIEEALDKAFGGEAFHEIVREIDLSAEEGLLEEPEKEVVIDAPIIRLVDKIIGGAIKMGASDIHIEAFEREAKIRYRLDGVLREIDTLPKSLHKPIISRIKILSNMDIAERRLPQDGRIGVKSEDRAVDLRVSSLPTHYGEGIVMRILDRSSVRFTLDELGFSEETDRVFKAQINRPNGIVLVTGPTGSGKSTTLYAALNAILSPEKKILTIEDPIEYNLYGVNQTQVKPEIGFTFASSLRSFLRHDPDIIMVGEMRDAETAQIAIEAALTGHLVLSTLHTNDAVGAVTRLIDMEIPPFLIASTLNCALAQRLVRKICSYCKIKKDPTPEELGLLKEYGISPEGVEWVKGEGCSNCGQTGYKGRVGIYEVVVMSEEIEKLILDKAHSSKFLAVAKREGMKLMAEDGVAKVAKGMTTVEELRRVICL